MSERMQVASGEVKVPQVYEGPVEVYIQNEFYCPDIFVEFNPDFVLPKVEKQWGGLYDCEPFCKTVAELIAKQNDLGEGDYNLARAELGMQGNEECAFEVFYRSGEDISHEFCENLGAVNLSKLEEEKERKRDAELEVLMTAEHKKNLENAFVKVRCLAEDLRTDLSSRLNSYHAEVQFYFGELLGFPNDYKHESQDDEHDLRHYFVHQLLARLKENVKGDFHSPDSVVLEIRIDDEDEEK